MATRSIRYLLGAVAAAAVLAGCGSQAQVNPSGAMAPSVARGQVAPDVKGGCTAHGGARVTPCTVTFTASSPGPDTVTTRHPHDKKGTFTESDNCTSTTGTTSTVIATVTQSTTPNQWTVTAGSATGSCTATFDYANKRGKIVGWANLSITNSI